MTMTTSHTLDPQGLLDIYRATSMQTMKQLFQNRAGPGSFREPRGLHVRIPSAKVPLKHLSYVAAR